MKMFKRKLLAMTMSVAMTLSLSTAVFAADLKDMPSADNWAYEALQSAVENGLLTGDGNQMLNPDGLLRRAEMAAVVNRAFGAVQTADLQGYTDVSTDKWYYLEMAKAVKMQTFQGSGTALNPESFITRQEAFAVLARALQLPAGDAAVLDQFSDGNQVSSSLKTELAAMVAAGYVKGNEGRLDPVGTITRAQFAQVMYNVIKTYVGKAEPVTELADGNVMVNVSDATLKGVTVKGDLIVGDGVGAGDFTMDGVKVEGRLVVRGGGTNSIKLTNGSSVSSVVVNKTSDGGVRIAPDASSTVSAVTVAGGKDSVVIEGKVGTLTIAGTSAVEIKGSVGNLVVETAAAGAAVTVGKDAVVDKMTSSAPNLKVSGEGKITEAAISGDSTSFDVAGTKVTVAEGTQGTTVGGAPVEGGKEVVSTPPATEGGTGGGGTGGGSGTQSYKSQIDAIFSGNQTQIVADLNDQGVDIALAFTSTAAGGAVTVRFSDSKIPTVGDASALMEHLVKDHTAHVLPVVNGAISYVKSITVGGRTLAVNDSINLDSVKTFVSQIFADNGWTAATATKDLPATVTVNVVDKYDNTYTYTVTRESLAQ